MSEQKEKKLFYIQLMENFFESDELIMIEEIALDKGQDPSAFQLIYLKLILKSLANDGLIKSDMVLTPQLIKTRIKFKTNRKREEDLKTIDEAIQSFEELGLVILNEKALFVKKALELTMSKQEESQKRFIERRRNKVLIDEMKLKSLNDLTDEEKERVLFEKRFNDEWLPGLLYCGYLTRENEKEFNEYKNVFDELTQCNLDLNDISEALVIFIKRSSIVDYNRVLDKKKYLFRTVSNIAFHEIKDVHNIHHDQAIDKLMEVGVITNSQDYQAVVGIMSRFESEGNTKEELKNAIDLIVKKDRSMLLNNSFGVSKLEACLELVLRKGGIKK